MSGLKGFAVRLRPGDDLKLSLERLVAERNIAAGFVAAGVGSLGKATLRLAGSHRDTVLTGPLELVSLSGTLAPEGLHLHAAVADAAGGVTGGHLRQGCTVRTTAEVVIGIVPEVTFRRTADPATGHRELEIEAIPFVVDEYMLKP